MTNYKRPQIALIYDFDGTLAPGNMQEFGFIQAIGDDIDQFWETINTTNIGLDLGFLQGELNVNLDWFQRDTKDMLAPGKELPSVLGTSAAYGNEGSLRSRGWEITIDYRHKFGDVNFYGTFNISDYKTKVTDWDSNNLINGYYTGKEYGEIWGFKTDRYFDFSDFSGKDDKGNWIYKEGVADQTKLQNGGFVYGPGDIKFVDVDGNGKIDWGEGTPDNHGDLVKIGNFTPRYQYSLRLGAEWKGFDIDLFMQGVGNSEAINFFNTQKAISITNIPWLIQ